MPGSGGCAAAGYDVTRFLEGKSIRYDVLRGDARRTAAMARALNAHPATIHRRARESQPS